MWNYSIVLILKGIEAQIVVSMMRVITLKCNSTPTPENKWYCFLYFLFLSVKIPGSFKSYLTPFLGVDAELRICKDRSYNLHWLFQIDVS